MLSRYFRVVGRHLEKTKHSSWLTFHASSQILTDAMILSFEFNVKMRAFKGNLRGLCGKPWAVKNHHWCADASHILGDAQRTAVNRRWGGGRELRCGMGISGLENTEEKRKFGKSLRTRGLCSSADWSSQLSLSLEHSNWSSQSTLQKRVGNGLSSIGQYT